MMTIAPILLINLLTPSAEAAWTQTMHEHLSDPIGVELALHREGAEPEQASILTGATEQVDAGAASSRRRQGDRSLVGWFEARGETVVDPKEATGAASREVCAEVVHDLNMVPGRKLVLYNGRVFDPSSSLASHTGLVLASGQESPLAIVHLEPGDHVQTTERVHRRTGAVTEHIELTRGDRVLTLDRSSAGSRLCFRPL